jgi:hypothetical protein
MDDAARTGLNAAPNAERRAQGFVLRACPSHCAVTALPRVRIQTNSTPASYRPADRTEAVGIGYLPAPFRRKPQASRGVG